MVGLVVNQEMIYQFFVINLSSIEDFDQGYEWKNKGIS